LSSLLTLFFLPQGKVFLEELDDALSIAEVIFFKLVDLLEGLFKGDVSKLTGSSVIFHHLVVEDREVEGESKLDRVACSKRDIVCLLVRFEGLMLHLFKLCILGVLSNVAIVVTNHLHKESLSFSLAFAVHHL